jgi:hypothetical protein
MTIRAHGEMSTHRKAPPARRVWIMCMCSAVLLAIGVRWSFRHQWSDVGLGLMFSAMKDVPATTVKIVYERWKAAQQPIAVGVGRVGRQWAGALGVRPPRLNRSVRRAESVIRSREPGTCRRV